MQSPPGVMRRGGLHSPQTITTKRSCCFGTGSCWLQCSLCVCGRMQLCGSLSGVSCCPVLTRQRAEVLLSPDADRVRVSEYATDAGNVYVDVKGAELGTQTGHPKSSVGSWLTFPPSSHAQTPLGFPRCRPRLCTHSGHDICASERAVPLPTTAASGGVQGRLQLRVHQR